MPLTLHAFCGLQDWLLFLCPWAQDRPTGLTSQWLGRYSNRQALTGTQRPFLCREICPS